MKLSDLRRLAKEDFAGVEWIDKLLVPLNRFMESVSSALSRNLSLADNLAARVVELDVDVPATPADAWPKFINCGVSQPIGMQLLRVKQRTGAPVALTGAVSVDWEPVGDGRLKVKAVEGLTASTNYRVTLVVWVA